MTPHAVRRPKVPGIRRSEAVAPSPRVQPADVRPAGLPGSNRAARALLHQTRSQPIEAVRRGLLTQLLRADPARVARAWEPQGGGVDKWDTDTGSKRWRRRAAGQGFEYSFEITGFTTIDEEYEGQWKSEEAWEALHLHIPQAPAPEPPLPVSGPGGWDIGTFFGVLQSRGLPGLCNALTAAYLTDLIAPPAGRPGISEHNFHQVVLLKGLLDEVTSHFYDGNNSAFVTYTFVSWFKARGYGGDWLDTLTPSIQSDALEDFKDYYKDFRHEAPPRRTAEAVGRFENLTGQYLDHVLEDLLSSFFTVDTAFKGTVVIQAEMWEDDTDEQVDDSGNANHEFAIEWQPQGQVFSIYDQNGGLVAESMAGMDEITDTLAAYLYNNYIENPMRVPDGSGGIGATNYARFEFAIFP